MPIYARYEGQAPEVSRTERHIGLPIYGHLRVPPVPQACPAMRVRANPEGDSPSANAAPHVHKLKKMAIGRFQVFRIFDGGQANRIWHRRAAGIASRAQKAVNRVSETTSVTCVRHAAITDLAVRAEDGPKAVGVPYMRAIVHTRYSRT